MPKPWAKYVVGFIGHDKFRAITPNAICLWLEGKNYADEKHTDGLLPEYEVKHWRFFSRKSVELLTRSCGTKPGTDRAYAALWALVDGFGYRMHDYLDHNDSREEALARIAKVEVARETEKQRKAEWRAAKAAKQTDVSDACPAVVPPLVPRDNGPLSQVVPSMSRSIQRTEPENREQKERVRKTPNGRAVFTEAFTTFWSHYPRRVGKAKAWAAWQKLDPSDELVGQMLATLTWQKKQDDWTKDNGQFIPHPATWINTGRWDDEPTEVSAPATPVNKRIAGLVAGGQAFLNRRQG